MPILLSGSGITKGSSLIDAMGRQDSPTITPRFGGGSRSKESSTGTANNHENYEFDCIAIRSNDQFTNTRVTMKIIDFKNSIRPVAYQNSINTPDFFSDKKMSVFRYLYNFYAYCKTTDGDQEIEICFEDRPDEIERLYVGDVLQEIQHQCKTHDHLSLDDFKNLPYALDLFNCSYSLCSWMALRDNYKWDLTLLLSVYRLVDDIKIHTSEPMQIFSSISHTHKVTFQYQGLVIELSFQSMTSEKDKTFYLFDESGMEIFDLKGKALSDKQTDRIIKDKSLEIGVMLTVAEFIVKAGMDKEKLIQISEWEYQ